MEEEEGGSRARSFRKEDYKNRRAFLRSYPLQWDDAAGGDDDYGGGAAPGGQKKSCRGGGGGGRGGACRKGGGKVSSATKLLDSLKLQRVAAAVSRWGGCKVVLLLRKLKNINRVVFYLVACQLPFRFNKPNANHLKTTA